MTKFLTRESAREFLRNELGVIVAGEGLKDHATRGTGPRYSLINGRACYTAADLTAWVAEQANRPLRARKSKAFA